MGVGGGVWNGAEIDKINFLCGTMSENENFEWIAKLYLVYLLNKLTVE